MTRGYTAATVGFGLAIAAALFSWRGTAQKASGYANPAVCAGCHQEIAKSYRLTGMGRSFYRPRADNPVGDFRNHNQLHNQASDRYYTMLERDGKLYERRHQLGFGGVETNVVEASIDYVMGSGNHARTYLHRTAAGKLMELPVSWYAENGGYWAMSPGYDRADQQDFRRAIPYDCMFCHNGYPAQAPAEGPEAVFGETLPEGIDCQRCHGPGAAHVAAASGGAAKETIRGAIVNPARLSRERQLEVCMQCHLETTSRSLPNSIRRWDRAPFSYRPGEALGNYEIFFDRGGEPEDRLEIAHAAYRLRKSACFQAGTLTCTTCHNPHAVPRGEEATAHYEKVCRSCHQAAHASGAAVKGSCMDCHMPKRRAEDAVHVVVTDHYIRRRQPAGDLLAARSEEDGEEGAYRGPVALYYPAQVAPAADQELYLAVAQVKQSANLKAGIPRLEADLAKYRPAAAEFYYELGKAYSKAGQPAQDVRWQQEALRRRSGYQAAQRELASAQATAGNLTEAAALLEKLVAASPKDPALLAHLGSVRLQQGQFASAREWLEKSLALDSEQPEARNQLGMVRLQGGDRAAAEQELREAIRLQPDRAAAHHNLGSLLAGARDFPQAEYEFQKAIAADPAYAEAHYSYGTLLILMQRYDGAIEEMRQAVKLDPKPAQVHSDLADLLAAKGDAAGAIAEYRLAVARDPELYEAHLALGMLLASRGAAAEARAHLQKAAQSSDPEVRGAALKALR